MLCPEDYKQYLKRADVAVPRSAASSRWAWAAPAAGRSSSSTRVPPSARRRRASPRWPRRSQQLRSGTYAKSLPTSDTARMHELRERSKSLSGVAGHDVHGGQPCQGAADAQQGDQQQLHERTPSLPLEAVPSAAGMLQGCASGSPLLESFEQLRASMEQQQQQLLAAQQDAVYAAQEEAQQHQQQETFMQQQYLSAASGQQQQQQQQLVQEQGQYIAAVAQQNGEASHTLRKPSFVDFAGNGSVIRHGL